VVEAVGTRLQAIDHGVIKNPASRSLTRCLLELDQQLRSIIARTKPDVAAIEGIFFCKNARTALILGQARGVALLACTSAGLPIFEHEPRRVKQALVGHGAAEKSQVALMVMRLLGLPSVPEQEDATDALAIAICQIQARTGYAALDPEPM
jgi:crossover junction endodeoxyribonuclease RuvC